LDINKKKSKNNTNEEFNNLVKDNNDEMDLDQINVDKVN